MNWWLNLIRWTITGTFLYLAAKEAGPWTTICLVGLTVGLELAHFGITIAFRAIKQVAGVDDMKTILFPPKEPPILNFCKDAEERIKELIEQERRRQGIDKGFFAARNRENMK